MTHKIRVAKHAPVFGAAVLEYLCAEILDMSGNICLQSKKVWEKFLNNLFIHIEKDYPENDHHGCSIWSRISKFSWSCRNLSTKGEMFGFSCSDFWTIQDEVQYIPKQEGKIRKGRKTGSQTRKETISRIAKEVRGSSDEYMKTKRKYLISCLCILKYKTVTVDYFKISHKFVQGLVTLTWFLNICFSNIFRASATSGARREVSGKIPVI